MRHRAVLVASLFLVACSAAPITHSDSQKASIDQVVEFLMTSAATDFHTHRPPDPVRFRDVRLGHVMTSDGKEQYLLCGQFLPQKEGNAEWMPFVTIKTSGYEQWIGGQADVYCQRPAVIWDKAGDLSPSLQSRLDSLR